jgi:hypothetical protein
MNPRLFALIGGIIMVAMGAISLIPGMEGPREGLPILNVETSYGLFLGYFPMNVFNKVTLIVLGLAGIGAYMLKFNSLPRSILWSRVVFFVMAIAAILGIIPQTNTLYGYWPLFGGMVIANSIFAIAGAYYGYYLTSKVPDSGPAVKNFSSPMGGTR